MQSFMVIEHCVQKLVLVLSHALICSKYGCVWH